MVTGQSVFVRNQTFSFPWKIGLGWGVARLRLRACVFSSSRRLFSPCTTRWPVQNSRRGQQLTALLHNAASSTYSAMYFPLEQKKNQWRGILNIHFKQEVLNAPLSVRQSFCLKVQFNAICYTIPDLVILLFKIISCGVFNMWFYCVIKHVSGETLHLELFCLDCLSMLLWCVSFQTELMHKSHSKLYAWCDCRPETVRQLLLECGQRSPTLSSFLELCV